MASVEEHFEQKEKRKSFVFKWEWKGGGEKSGV
jgi:hypothetical protein